ncbi:MAG: hypothetical protein K2M85_04095 [Paramuribaculum sp.]|nr:hypothetical protein [Paramuribaculum sp.]
MRALLIIIAVIALFSSCTPTKYIPVETVRTEYKEADTTAIYNRLLRLFESRMERETLADSLIDRTKETVVLTASGDTARHDTERVVYRSTSRERELEHKVREQDSIISSLRTQLSSVKADSIQVPYPVEMPLSRWQQAKMDFGGVAIGVVLAVLCIAVSWLIKKFRV